MSDAARIVGAGSVGLALAARLARGGVAVELLARRPEAAQRLTERGLVAEDAASGARRGFRVRAVCSAEGFIAHDAPLFVCTRAADVPALAPILSGLDAAIVTFQNDVESEAAAARFAPLVVGGVWRETVTRVTDDLVRFQTERPGRAVVGLHPHGASEAAERVAALLRRGDVDVSVSPSIARDKWLKLAINLMSTPNALVRRPDHTTPAFVDVKARLLEEARDVFAAARIDATPCDARDRTLEAEIAFQRESLARGTSARNVALYNQVWTSLRHGAPLEADDYHRRVLALAREHRVAAPVNERVLAQLLAARAAGLGPECYAAAALLPG